MASRRGFLGMLAGAATAGPRTVSKLVPTSMADLSLRSMGINANATEMMMQAPPTDSDGPQLWAKRRLRSLLGMSRREQDLRRKRIHIEQLEPSVAVLRSVSLTQKIRLTRDITYHKSLEQEHIYLLGVVEKFWS